MANKIYRTVIQFEILSEEPFPDSLSLSDIDHETMDGHMSGRFLDNVVTDEELTGLAAVEAIKNQGSDPDFFNMDEAGNDIEEDYFIAEED